MAGDALSRAIHKYRSEKYDQVNVQVPTGCREQLKALAAAEGMSLNRYILEAVEQRSGLKLTLDGELPWKNKSK